MPLRFLIRNALLASPALLDTGLGETMGQRLSHVVHAFERRFSSLVGSVSRGQKWVVSLIAIVLVSGTSTGSLAADIVYGDFMGSQVTFLDLTESSAHPLPLYGSPTNAGNLPGTYPPCTLADNCTISGNSLHFSPVLFDAESINQTPPSELTDGQLTFMVESKPGQSIQNIDFQESGAFTIGGFAASNTDDTYVQVTGTGSITVLAIDGNTNITPLSFQFNLATVFDTAPGGQFLATNQWRFMTEGAESSAWTGSGQFDITQELLDDSRLFTLGATKISVNFDNILFAQSEPLGTARIDKKLFLTVTVNIPEPTSCLLAMFGLVAGVLVSRRSC